MADYTNEKFLPLKVESEKEPRLYCLMQIVGDFFSINYKLTHDFIYSVAAFNAS